MTLALTTLGAALLGAFAWTLAEYLLHRFAGHRRRSQWLFTREHLRHHRELDWFSPLWRKIALAAGILLVAGGGLLWAAGLPGLAAVVGFLLAYGAYERAHERLHTHAPAGVWGRWARRHHWLHHAMDPSSNHGVTTALWDIVFGTHRTEPVTVHPGRAPSWLLDEAGVVKPAHRGSFRVQPGAPRPASKRP